MQCKQAHEYACIKCNQTKFMSLLPLFCVLLLSKNFDPSFLQCCSPFVHVHVLSLPFVQSLMFVQSFPISFISLYNFSPLSSIFIKCVLLIDAKVCIWGRWLRLESCIFYGHHLIVGMTLLVDTTCNLYYLYLV